MISRPGRAVSAAIALLIAGTAGAQDDPLATVNGTAITHAEVEAFMEQANRQMPLQQAVQQVITRQLMLQEAQEKNLAEKPEVQERIEAARREVLISAAVDAALETNPITEEELKKEYEQLKPRLEQSEFHARHILVEEKETAAKLIKQLNEGADFAELAKEHSTGPTGPKGGDLGWFSAGQMVAPFSQAVEALEDGAITDEPVQTQFGWHVIKREGKRTTDAPPLEQIEDQLRNALQQKHLSQYIDQLVQKSDVKINLPAPAAPQIPAQ